MLFFHSGSTELLQRVIRAAVASDRPAALSAFLASHGDKPFAQALSGLSGSVIADALALLPARERARVAPRLSRLARRRLHDLDHAARLAPCRLSARYRALYWLFGDRANIHPSGAHMSSPSDKLR